MLRDEAPLTLVYKQNSSGEGKFLEWNEIDNLFIYKKGLKSLDQCNSDLTKLYTDSLGLIERTSLDVSN
jgi:hypothetical protein